MWTIETGHEFDAETYETYEAWHVVDEEGEPIQSFREREDAIEWLEEKQDEEGDCFDARRFQDHDDR